ncbi:MAG: DUF349 domain-containing protein [Reichenbachiella sp.]|uniref:DUF349 domain-containing protein n=1 Tax=Reichenbachiella sp. TaxID=2184521 RepID=UPI0032664666
MIWLLPTIVEIPFGHLENNVLYRSAFDQVEALKLKEVAEDEAADAVTFFLARFDKLKLKLDEIEKKINSENNKGSFLSSLQNLKETVLIHEGLGDYQKLLDRIAPLESMLLDYIDKNRSKNTEIKKALLAELEPILANNDQEEAFEQIKDLKSRWLKTGQADLEMRTELESKFKTGVDGFFEKRNAFNEDKKMLIAARVSEYESIIAEIKSYLDKKDFQQSADRVKELQKQWKEVGHIPEKDFTALNEKYWKVAQDYFNKQKKQRNADRKNKIKDQKEGLKVKSAILEEFKVLVQEAWVAEEKDFEALKAKWKGSGHVSKKSHPEIHEGFIELSREWQEKRFIWSLAQRKNKGFAKKQEKDQLKDLTKTIRDLLYRDETELKSFNENMDKMHINKGSFVDMLQEKLAMQEGKVALKRRFLKECQEKIKQL